VRSLPPLVTISDHGGRFNLSLRNTRRPGQGQPPGPL